MVAASAAEAVAGAWQTLHPALSENTLSTLINGYGFPTMTPVQAFLAYLYSR